MNDYEMMNQRIDQPRLELDRLNQKEQMIKQLKADVMDELLDTRRQITKLDGCVMEQFPTDPTTLRFEARDIEIGAPSPVYDYAGWIRACADRIEKLEEALKWYDDPSSQGDVARAALKKP